MRIEKIVYLFTVHCTVHSSSFAPAILVATCDDRYIFRVYTTNGKSGKRARVLQRLLYPNRDGAPNSTKLIFYLAEYKCTDYNLPLPSLLTLITLHM